MRSSHRLPLIARVVMTWFVLVLSVSVLSPALNPKTLERLCAADGSIRLVVRSQSGDVSESLPHTPTLDCPLCALHQLPPPTAQLAASFSPPPRSALVLPGTLSPLHGALSRAPLPARGPPVASNHV